MKDLLLNSFLLGIALSMDAFSVSVASGLAEPDMKKSKMFRISGVFGTAQFLMPVIGWFCVHSLVELFSVLEKYIPWAALLLLLYLGIRMIVEGLKRDSDVPVAVLGNRRLLVLGIATSIDALSVGFTISDLNTLDALLFSLIIGIVTFLICMVGVAAGKKIGTKLSSVAPVIGGAILIAIGIEIFVKGVF